MSAWSTWADIDGEGALRDGDASECNVDGVRAGLHGFVGATEDAFALVFHDGLHGVLITERVFDDGGHVTHSGTWSTQNTVASRLVFSRKVSSNSSLHGQTCGVDVKEGGFVGEVAQRLQSGSFSRDFSGVSQGFCPHSPQTGSLGFAVQQKAQWPVSEHKTPWAYISQNNAWRQSRVFFCVYT